MDYVATERIRQNPKGKGRGNSSIARLANAKLVHKSLQTNEATICTVEVEQDVTNTTNSSERDSSAVAENKPQSLPLIRESLDKYELSPGAKDILMASWRSGTNNNTRHT